MNGAQYPKVDGVPHEFGAFFADDHEYGELTLVVMEYHAPSESWIGSVVGWDEYLDESLMDNFTFYGPIPVPEKTEFKLRGHKDGE